MKHGDVGDRRGRSSALKSGSLASGNAYCRRQGPAPAASWPPQRSPNLRGRGRVTIIESPGPSPSAVGICVPVSLHFVLGFALMQRNVVELPRPPGEDTDLDELGWFHALVALRLAVFWAWYLYISGDLRGRIRSSLCSISTGRGTAQPPPIPSLPHLARGCTGHGYRLQPFFSSPIAPVRSSYPASMPTYPHHDRLWISDTLSPFNSICPAHVSLPLPNRAHRKRGDIPTQMPPRLLVVLLCDLFHLDRVVDH